VASGGDVAVPRNLVRPLIVMAAGVAAGTLALLLVAQLGAFSGMPPADLGVREGRLKPPSETPNSVHSQAALWPDHPQRTDAQIDPLPLRGDGPATIARIRAIAAAMPGATVVDAQPGYLYVTFRTRWMGFVDDAEFWFDAGANVVQVRSGSRLGRRDFGVNRERIEVIRTALAAG
jgi:uncharacterized protein (DUF1499 family)